MASTNAQVLLGSTFSFNSVTIGEVIAVSGNFMTRNTKPILTADSVGGVAQHIAGGAVPGTLSITCILDPSASGGYDSLTAAIEAGTEAAATFTFGAAPDTSSVGATLAVLTNLDLPSAGSPEEEFTVSLSVTPLDEGGWDYTDLAA